MRNAWAVASGMWVAMLLVCGATAGTGADSTVSGLHYANQVVRDTTGDSALAKGASSAGQVAAAEDIAQFSSRTVTLHDLDLLVRNHRRGRVAVRVHDAAGREVLARDYGPGRATISVAMDAVPRGIYVYSVRVADSVFASTFVVTR